MKREPGALRGHPLVRLLRWLRPHALPAAGVYAALLLTSAVALAAPLVLRAIIDGATGARPEALEWVPGASSPEARLAVAGLLLLGLGVARGGLSFVQRYGTQWVGRQIATDLRRDVFAHLLRLDAGYHARASVGRHMTNLTSDPEQVRSFAGTAVADVVNIAVLLIGAAAVLFSIDTQLALIAFVPVPLIAVAAALFSRAMHPRFLALQGARSSLNARLQESITQVQVVKAFTAERRAHKAYVTDNEDVFDKRMVVSRAFTTLFPAMTVLLTIGTAAVLAFGGQRVIDGELSIGTLVAFDAYIVLLGMPVRRLGFLLNLASSARASAVRIFEVLDREPALADAPGAVELDAVAGRVTFDDVSFAFPGAQTPALRRVSLEVEPGETVAVVGPSGSGKTALVQLLPRLFDPSDGSVRVDGKDLRDVTRTSLRRAVGFVDQDAYLFSSSVHDNVAFAEPGAARSAVVAACKLAGAHEFISALPDGYDTLVGERGVTLSGGQRQRVALARTLLLDPPVLVMDDAMSAVDASTETRIRDALTAATGNRTVVVVAQRLSTILAADRIVVLEAGQLVESGTHAELLASDGTYARLFLRFFAADASQEVVA